jgi:hypothetical protein
LRTEISRRFIGIGGSKMAWSVGEKKVEPKRMGPNKVVEMHPPTKEATGETGPGKERDLAGGMEMLELDFLLGVVESTKGDDKNDVMMRKLSFNELLRRDKQNHIDSIALTVYAVNQGNLYGKDIQCEAMKELTKRTTHKDRIAAE